MLKSLLVVFALVPGLVQASGYGYVPHQKDRVKAGSDFVRLPFPTQYVVEESTGVPNPALISIFDNEIQAEFKQRKFSTMQVRELDINTGDTVLTDAQVVLPFVVSLKYTLNKPRVLGMNLNLSQGTLDVAGNLLITFDGKNLKVELTTFDDSSLGESFTRMFSFDCPYDLNFARRIVKPVIENYYRQNPDALKPMLTKIGVAIKTS